MFATGVLFVAVLLGSVLFHISLGYALAFAAFFSYLYYVKSSSGKEINPINKVVFVTGCDSGFGNRLARKLDDRGFHVVAGCLFPEGSGAKNLKEACSGRLKVLPLDVTSDESVANASKSVRDCLGSKVFWAVVNNAGVSKGSFVDFSTIEQFRETLDVNALGPVRMTLAFLPLLKESKGRIVNVTSIVARVPFILACPYTMSKHASAAFTENLCLEMDDWGVKAISVEPETFRTGISNHATITNRIKSDVKEIDDGLIASYGEEYFEKLEDMISIYSNWSSSNIDIVVDDMVSAVTKEHPNLVYKPRWSWYTRILSSVGENIPFPLFVKLFKMYKKQINYPVPKAVTK